MSKNISKYLKFDGLFIEFDKIDIDDGNFIIYHNGILVADFMDFYGEEYKLIFINKIEDKIRYEGNPNIISLYGYKHKKEYINNQTIKYYFTIKKSNKMNTVNSDNFNETMQGYINYMIDFIQPRLKEENYSTDDINRITQLIGNGLEWAKDDMTMEEARRYKK